MRNIKIAQRISVWSVFLSTRYLFKKKKKKKTFQGVERRERMGGGVCWELLEGFFQLGGGKEVFLGWRLGGFFFDCPPRQVVSFCCYFCV